MTSVFFVKNPDSIIDETLQSVKKNKKKVDEIDFSFFSDMQKISIYKNFRKHMDIERYKTQNPDMYNIESEYVKNRSQLISGGIAEITVEVRNDEGRLQNEEARDRKLKIPLFNLEDNHFMGYHLACLFLEGNSDINFDYMTFYKKNINLLYKPNK